MAKRGQTNRVTMGERPPKIRSLPGKLFVLTPSDLEEVRARFNAVQMSKGQYVLAQLGYNTWLSALKEKYGVPATCAINLENGEMVDTAKTPIMSRVEEAQDATV